MIYSGVPSIGKGKHACPCLSMGSKLLRNGAITMKEYTGYAVEQACALLAIDSPTGFTARAAD